MIEPTIGRVVWYHPKPGSGDPLPIFPNQPYVALVAGILSTSHINLAAFDHSGAPFVRDTVRLRQDDDIVEQGDAEWMPFQRAEAARRNKPAFDAEGSITDLRADLDQIGLSLLERIARLESLVRVGATELKSSEADEAPKQAPPA